MKKKQDIILRRNTGEFIVGKKLKFISRIDNDGLSIIPLKEPPTTIGRTEYVIHGLSITYKKWIATDGMSTYIVELVKK